MAINIMPPVLTLEQKATLKKLDGMLSIKDIALLRHKDDEDLIKAYAFIIAEACLTGELDFIHGVRAHDLRWVYDHPDTETILELPLDFETSPWPGSEAYSDINSAWCLESEWTGDPHPKPAYKYNDNSAKLRRLYTNNHNSAAYDFYRFDYAMGGRCLIGSETFKDWLIKKHDYPLPEGCLLENWFESVQKADNHPSTQHPDANKANEQLSIFEMRVKSFDEWRQKSGINIEALNVEKILIQLKQFNKKLWNIKLATFRRDFWQGYNKLNDGRLKKPRGRKAK